MSACSFVRCSSAPGRIRHFASGLRRHAPVPVHGARGEGHVCFTASREEIEGWRLRFFAADVAVEAEFDWPNGARSLYVRDPAGNSVEFAEPRLWD